MRAPCLHFFLTFVLILLALEPRTAIALPSAPSPDIEESSSPSEEPVATNASGKLKTIDISPSPAPSAAEARPEYFHPFRRALTFRVAMQYDTVSDSKNPSAVLGAQYLFSANNLKSYEVGADLQSDGAGVVHFAQRFIYSRSRFRPYWKAGAGLRVVPSERLATLLKYKNYYVRSALGFEQLVSAPSSLRAEIELTAGPRSIQALASLGYVWAW